MNDVCLSDLFDPGLFEAMVSEVVPWSRTTEDVTTTVTAGVWVGAAEQETHE